MEVDVKNADGHEDLSRRALMTALMGIGGVFGLSAIAGYAAGQDSVPLPAEEKFGRVSSAASGATLGWADDIADLRAMPATPAYAVVIAKGYHAAGDGGGGEFHWTTDTTSADDGGLTIVPTAGPRTGCFKRLTQNYINVKWFGAKGDGVAIDTTAIQNAITACGRRRGGLVLFPPGRYKTTSSLLVRTGSIALVGTGYASVIAPEGSFDTVVIQSNLLGTFLYGNRVVDLYFDEAGKTGGRTLYAERVAEFAAQRVTATSGYNGLAFSVYNSIVLADIRLTYYRGGLGSAYLRLTSGPTPSDRADVAWVRDCIFSTDQPRLSVGMQGVDIDGFVHTVNLSKVGIGVSGAEALIVRNSVAAADVPTFITANDLEIEFSQLECIRLDAGIKCSFATSMLHGSVSRDNVYVGSACRNIDFTSGTSTGAWQSGIAVAGRDVSITSMRFDTNCQLSSTGPYPGILVGGTSYGVVVTGCRSGSLNTPNSQRYGIQVDTGADNFCIVGNVFTNNRLGSNIIGTTLAANRVYASNAG